MLGDYIKKLYLYRTRWDFDIFLCIDELIGTAHMCCCNWPSTFQKSIGRSKAFQYSGTRCCTKNILVKTLSFGIALCNSDANQNDGISHCRRLTSFDIFHCMTNDPLTKANSQSHAEHMFHCNPCTLSSGIVHYKHHISWCMYCCNCTLWVRFHTHCCSSSGLNHGSIYCCMGLTSSGTCHCNTNFLLQCKKNYCIFLYNSNN